MKERSFGLFYFKITDQVTFEHIHQGMNYMGLIYELLANNFTTNS